MPGTATTARSTCAPSARPSGWSPTPARSCRASSAPATCGSARSRRRCCTPTSTPAHGRFRGIRQRATWDADLRQTDPDPGPGLLLDPAFRAGFEVLAELGLSFDAWLYFPQLPDLVDLARTYPDATIVLNHLGAPIVHGPYGDRDATLARWRASMTDVATCPNVVLKVGGIGMPMFGTSWLQQDEPANARAVVAAHWGDEVRFCIDTFGPDRCMFESNFSGRPRSR